MPKTTTTTTTAVQTNVNEGFKLEVSTDTNLQEIGNFVTDVSIQPWLAPQTISFFAYNMRPGQRVHIFFDGVLVDQYCAPGSTDGNGIYVENTSDNATFQHIPRGGMWGDAIYVDNSGHVAGQFNVPAATFKTGQRVIQIADVDNLITGKNAITTIAHAEFTASNLAVTKQITTLTTINPVFNYVPVTNTYTTSTTWSSSVTEPDIYNIIAYWWEPLAQILTISTPNKESGVFATSLDLYFQGKSQPSSIVGANNGIIVYLCETDNGYPNGTVILPFSYVHLNREDVNISEDASVPTRFTFESPVFLADGTDYAFIIKPDNNDPDYKVWCAHLGDVDVTTGAQVYSQPVMGTAFEGATVKQWSALQAEYIKFKLNVASFEANTGTAVFHNTNQEYITMLNIGYTNTSVTPVPGDIAFQAANSYTNSTGSSCNTSVYGVVNWFDNERQILYLQDSSGNWDDYSYVQIHRFANTNVAAISATASNVNNSTQIAYANTYVIYNPRINAIVPEFATLVPPGTSIEYSYTGTSNTYVADSSNTSIVLGTETNLIDYERLAASRTNEVTYNSGNPTVKVEARFKSDSYLLSPMIDTVRANVLGVRNLIDPISSVYNEFYNSGKTRSKYISRIITLADGQDAEDLQIVLSAHRPPNTQIQVWVKFINADDPEAISEKTWTPMRNLAADVYSDPTNPRDYREFVYQAPFSFPLMPTTGTVTCSNTSNTVTGVSTLFANSTANSGEIFVGYWVNMPGTATYSESSRKVIEVTSNTSLTLDAPFGGNYTNTTLYVVPPPTTAWVSQDSKVQISGIVNTYTTNTSIIGHYDTFSSNTGVINSTNSIAITNANTYYTAGQRVQYYVPSGNTAVGGLVGNNFYYIKTSNNTHVKLTDTTDGNELAITATAFSETHSLNTTNFKGEIVPGFAIQVGADKQTVVSVTNATHLSVGTPWSENLTNETAYNITNAGLTYYNNAGSLFTSYKMFQVKVVLQSDNPARVPLIDNLRAMALQL